MSFSSFKCGNYHRDFHVLLPYKPGLLTFMPTPICREARLKAKGIVEYDDFTDARFYDARQKSGEAQTLEILLNAAKEKALSAGERVG